MQQQWRRCGTSWQSGIMPTPWQTCIYRWRPHPVIPGTLALPLPLWLTGDPLFLHVPLGDACSMHHSVGASKQILQRNQMRLSSCC